MKTDNINSQSYIHQASSFYDGLVNDEYIIGHNNYRDSSTVWERDGLIFEQRAYENIIYWMNEFIKNYDDIIASHSSFFDSLYDIKQIIVIGHSMSKVDWPYFREIIKNIGKEIPWIVYCHSIDDRNNTNLFKSVFELSSVTIKDN